jgi:hypothetical protein
MRSILVKSFALQNSITIGRYTAWNAVGNATWDVPFHAVWNVVLYAAERETCNLAKDAALGVGLYIMNNEAKRGKNPEEIIDLACLSVIDNYQGIFLAVDKLGSAIKSRTSADWNQVLKSFITFDDEKTKNLGSMNRRFKFFYFLRVHEILSMLVENEELMTDFYKLLKKNW